MSSRKSHILLKKHPYTLPLMYVRAISWCGVAHSQSTLLARPGGFLHHLCAGSYALIHSCTVIHRRRSAGVRSESQASFLLSLCYAHASIRAARMHSYVQILSHSHIPGHPCVLLHSPSLSSFLTCIHPPAYQWPHLTASHMLL